jgi:hypothetical protein
MIAFKEVAMTEMKFSRARRWTAEQARAVLAEIDRRGISVNRFAAEKGLGAERLYRWKRLLGRRRRLLEARGPRFAEVTVLPGAWAASIEIDLGGGISLRVCGESRVDDAVAVVSRLEAR